MAIIDKINRAQSSKDDCEAAISSKLFDPGKVFSGYGNFVREIHAGLDAHYEPGDDQAKAWDVLTGRQFIAEDSSGYSLVNGTLEIPTLTNPATAADVAAGYKFVTVDPVTEELIIQEGTWT